MIARPSYGSQGASHKTTAARERAAAVRLLLPRRLQAQVGNQLDTLGLKAALAD